MVKPPSSWPKYPSSDKWSSPPSIARNVETAITKFNLEENFPILVSIFFSELWQKPISIDNSSNQNTASFILNKLILKYLPMEKHKLTPSKATFSGPMKNSTFINPWEKYTNLKISRKLVISYPGLNSTKMDKNFLLQWK